MTPKSIIRKFLYVATLNPLIKRTQWYKNKFIDYDHRIYPDNTWYRNHSERNFQLVALGSSAAKWAYDFDEIGVKAMNWANQPQTLLEDFNLLRCYHSILAKHGIVIITIMPFTGLNKLTGVNDALKYLELNTHGEPIEPHLVEQAARLRHWPVLFGKPAIKAMIKYIIGKDSTQAVNPHAMQSSNPMDGKALELDANHWIEGWKSQFAISDLNAPLTPANAEGRTYRIELMRRLIDFCTERSYRPVYVIPPMTSHLAKHFSPQFLDTYVYGFLRQVERDIPILDYSVDHNLQDDDLYFNSFFLNKKGRQLFTRKLLLDLPL